MLVIAKKLAIEHLIEVTGQLFIITKKQAIKHFMRKQAIEQKPMINSAVKQELKKNLVAEQLLTTN
jgi:hypothetical protein